MTGFFRTLRRAAPAAHKDVFAEFSMRLLGLLLDRRRAARRHSPRFRVVR